MQRSSVSGELAANRLPAGFLKRALPVQGSHLATLFLLSLVSNALILVGPIFMLQVYDRVLGSRSIPTLVALTILIVALFGFSGLVELFRSRMGSRIGSMIHFSLADEALKSVVVSRSGDSEGGDALRDLDALRAFASSPAPLSIMDLPWLPLYGVLIFALSPLLGWLAVAGAVVMLALVVASEVTASPLSREVNSALGAQQRAVEDIKANHAAIMAMGMLGSATSRFVDRADRVVLAQRRLSDRTAIFSISSRVFRTLLQSLVLALGAYLVIAGELSAGLMLATSVITSRALAPIEQVVGSWKGFVAARQAARRLAGRIAPMPYLRARTELPRPARSLDVAGVVAGPRPGLPIAADINFTLVAGEGLGIIGPSGGGKSSVLRAIVGIWPCLRGAVRFDGADREQFDPTALGRAIGYLPQEVELFDGTVAENIGRLEGTSTSAQVIAAATAAGSHELILQLSNGYDTDVGPRGRLLSAGQRQRIGLARALFGNPFLIALDEPNANLDRDGEEALTRALTNAKARGAVVILVAHRPSAIAVTEKLLFMAGGRQVAYGGRDDVLARMTKTAAPIELTPGKRSHG